MNIPSVPTEIAIEDVKVLICGLGIDPDDLLRLEILPHVIHAEVCARGSDGQRFLTTDALVATHDITIKIQRGSDLQQRGLKES